MDQARLRPLRGDLVFALVFGALTIAMHVPWLARHGFHRDELYYLSCGARPALGYADFAPLTAWAAGLSSVFGGPSVEGLRVLPLLAGAANVVLVAWLARSLGGGRFAMALAAVCTMLAPVFARVSGMLAAPSFEPVLWSACALVLVRLLREGPSRAWLLFGVLSGVACWNKHTALILGFGVFVGLALTRHRRQLATRWPWLGALVAFAIFAPHLVWQATHGWPTVAFVRRLSEAVHGRIDAAEFIAGQFIYVGPLAALVWVGGLGWLVFGGGGRFRPLAWLYVVVIGVLLWTGGKAYYSMPIYPALLAAGGVAWERVPIGAGVPRTLLRSALLAAVTLAGLAFAPLSLPALAIEDVDRFAQKATLGLVANSHEVTGDLHDMFGWHEHAAAVAEVWRALPADERSRGFVWGGNYGEAGCLEHLWPGDDRPPVASNHMSWHFFGPPPDDRGAVAIALCWNPRHLLRMFEDVEQVGTSPGHGQALERDVPIWRCRRPRGPLAERWPRAPDL